MSQPSSICSTPYSNPQNISSQKCVTLRAITVSASPCNIAISPNANDSRSSPTNNSVNRLNPHFSIDYSSTPNISPNCALSSYCTANPQSLRASQSCSVCNLSTQYPQ
ncbi:unnamed protein product, partial [Meganyctiphanes norvegica]